MGKEGRTLEEYVRDMKQRGKTAVQIRAVALATRWRDYLPELEVLMKG